jgi:hypothetical protein
VVVGGRIVVRDGHHRHEDEAVPSFIATLQQLSA